MQRQYQTGRKSKKLITCIFNEQYTIIASFRSCFCFEPHLRKTMSEGWWFGSLLPSDKRPEQYTTEFKILITTERALEQKEIIKEYETVIENTLNKSVYFMVKFKAHDRRVGWIHSLKTGENTAFVFVDIIHNSAPSELGKNEAELRKELGFISWHMATDLKFKLSDPICMWSVRSYKPED